MDRLADLQKWSSQFLEPPGEIQETKELETGHREFLTEIEGLNENLHNLSMIVEELRRTSEWVVYAVLPQREEYYSRLFSEHIHTGNDIAKMMKTRIHTLQNELRRLKTEGELPNNAEIRLRENLINTVSVKYSQIMKDYQAIQTQSKAALRKKVARQITLVNPDCTQNEVEEALQQESSQDYIKDAILKHSKTPSESIQNAYQVAQGKYEDMKLLEKSMADLRELFIDLGTITAQQGELLDQIEFNAGQADEYVEEGNEEMRQATTMLISTQAKRALIIVIVLIIIGLIIGLSIAGSRGNL